MQKHAKARDGSLDGADNFSFVFAHFISRALRRRRATGRRTRLDGHTYIDVFSQHLVAEPVLLEHVGVSAVSGGRGSEKETEETARVVSFCPRRVDYYAKELTLPGRLPRACAPQACSCPSRL
jgi:hypothetical protein